MGHVTGYRSRRNGQQQKVSEHTTSQNQFKIKYVMSTCCFWKNLSMLVYVTSVQLYSCMQQAVTSQSISQHSLIQDYWVLQIAVFMGDNQFY